MNDFFKTKRVLVTGGCGTVGLELVRQLLQYYEVEELIALDNNESELLFFRTEFFRSWDRLYFFLADILVLDKFSVLCNKFKEVDVVFHAAAFKHVILCERSPFEAVQTNILGTQNIILAAIDNKVQLYDFYKHRQSSQSHKRDGNRKLMCERLMTAANSNMRDNTRDHFRFDSVCYVSDRGDLSFPYFASRSKRAGLLHSRIGT